MKTLTEMENERAAREDKAWRFERLTNAVGDLRRSIAAIEAQHINTEALERIYELCGDVPPGLTTKGNRFIAGGFLVRELLTNIAADALAVVQRKRQAVEAALATDRAKLAQVEVALKDLD